MNADLLPLPVVFPLGGAMLAPVLARAHRRLPLIVGMVALAGSLVVLGYAVPSVLGGSGSVIAHFFSNARPVHGAALGVAFAADPFGLCLALLTAGLGLLLLLSLLSEFGGLGHREIGGLACLFQLLLAAVIAAALTADTVDLFVWFEVAALSSYGLTGFFLERPIALEAAFKNLVLTSMAGFLLFVGAAMLYTRSGALNLGQLQHVLPASPPRIELIAIALMTAGLCTKAGLIPFHAWLPDAHTPVPGAVSALFSALMVDIGILGVTRLSLQVVPQLPSLRDLLTVLGMVSAVVGALFALLQDDLKRLLAWDTVSQVGIVVVGMATRTADGVAGAVYHLVNHGLFKALLFLCAGAVVHATGLTNLSELGGLARRRPVLTVCFTVGSASIAGVPPLNGYASLGLIHSSLEEQPVLYGAAVVAQVLTVAALARAAYLAFYRHRDEDYEDLERPHTGMLISLFTLVAGCIAFGVLADPFVRHLAGPAAAGLLAPGRYAAGVLTGTHDLAALPVEFSYGDPATIFPALGELAAGLLLAAWVVRAGAPAWTATLRRIHTGSVNDYAGFAAIGLAVVGYVLAR